MKIQCELCPKMCIIQPGQSGECRVRINIDGVLRTVVYGYPCSLYPYDAIEKKPLFHFLPGTRIFSVATVGCNLHCKNCQNWEISQANPEESQAYVCSPEKLVALVKERKCPSLAYTYSDPIIYYEYTYDTAKLAKNAGIRNVLVTAGYINEQPWKQLLKYIDAVNIDLKGITDEFYREVCSATLKPVQNALVVAKASGVHVEVTNLIIPTLNDKPEQVRELVRWVKTNMGADTPFHFSGFFPKYKLMHLPPTSQAKLETAREIAMSEGLNYVYIGNVTSKEGQNTYCPLCKELLIERSGYTIMQNRLRNGTCPKCNKEIYGVWR
ncbi:MAG: AmmeMemoRadiSam system radical SAM enzyme [Planctomycetes bacterium RBG_13_44_8b]|nr:MAG: AmmeMemoRadiSam system radical SAM enzyme [Planctomycetes bacterium RBG_13_44_8b]